MMFLLAAFSLSAVVQNVQEPDVTTFINSAREAKAKKNWQESLEHYDRALAQKPDSDEALFERAQLYSWMKRFPESIRDYRRHIQLFPEKKAQSEKNLGRVLAWSKQFKAGIAMLEPYAAQGDREAILDQARFKSWDGQFNASLKQADAYLAEHPDDAEFLALRGRVRGWSGEHAKARRDFELALHKRPQDKDALLGLAQLELWQNNPEGAEQYLNQLTPEDAGSAEAAMVRNRMDEKYGRLQKAKKDLAPWRNDPEAADDVYGRTWELAAKQGPYVELSHGRVDSNEDLRQDMDNLDVGIPLLDGTLRGGINKYFLKQPTDRKADVNQVYLGLNHPLGNRFRLGAMVYRATIHEKQQTDYDLNVDYRAAKGVNLGVGYSRMMVLASPVAVDNEIAIKNLTLRGTWVFGEGLNIANGSFETGKTSRDSSRRAYNVNYIRRLVFQQGEARVGAVARGMRYNPHLDLGFFNPERMDFLGFNGGFTWRKEGLYEFNVDGQVGTQKVDQTPSKFAWSYTATLSTTPFSPGVVFFGSFGQCAVALNTVNVTDPTQYRDRSFKLGVRLISPRWFW